MILFLRPDELVVETDLRRCDERVVETQTLRCRGRTVTHYVAGSHGVGTVSTNAVGQVQLRAGCD